MADPGAQSFEHHMSVPKPFLCAVLLMLIGTILGVVGLFFVNQTAGTCLIGSGFALYGFTGIVMMFILRRKCTKLQDRIIRTEMRVRLAALLPEEERGEIAKLSMGQLISLRFASDGELPELMRAVLEEGIQDRKAIKGMIKEWEGDYDRV